MPTFSTMQIAPPKSWEEFETICRDLWSKILNDPDMLKHGGKGQRQDGVDIYGKPKGNDSYVGILM